MANQQPIDVRDMAIVHRTFRNAFTESAQLIRANPTPTSGRVTFLSDHVDFLLGMIHHHHASEDEYLYPLLVQRAPEQAAETELTQRQHGEVEGTIEAASAACTSWRSNPSTETGRALAEALDALNAALQPHLDDEERTTVPLAAVTLTQSEWNELGEHGTAGIPKKMLPVAFGMLLEPLNESDREHMKAELPAFVRMFYGLMIQRPWNKYAATLRTGI
ncbi:MAG: hemerythrin domain-containing protein [Actinomycetes bacterium]